MLKKLKDLFLSIDWKNVSASVIVRYIMSIIVTINTVLTFFDLNPLLADETVLSKVVSFVLAIITIVVALYNTYKNNSTSKEAMIGDLAKDILKGISDASEKEEAIDKLSVFLESMKESVAGPTDVETSSEEDDEDDDAPSYEPITDESDDEEDDDSEITEDDACNDGEPVNNEE